MGLRGYLQFTLIAAATATAQVQQPLAGDPNTYNNQQINQQIMQNGNTAPSILGHGSGNDINLDPTPTATDKQFARLTAMRAMLEIQLGQMALEKSSSPEVKALAQRMVEDYTKWQHGLDRVAPRVEVNLPDSLDKRNQALIDQMKALNGAEFDKAYLAQEMRMADRALTITQNEASHAGLPRFRNWAGLMMPTLEQHRKLVKAAMEPTAVASR